MLPGRCIEMALQALVARGQRLRLVERLRAHLADMIDPHQPACMAALHIVERRIFCDRLRRARPRRVAGSGDGAKRIVCGNQEAIEHVAGGVGASCPE